MILEASLVLLGTVMGALTGNYLEGKVRKKQIREHVAISIRKALDLTQVPVVKFYDGDMELNFILDSGSSHSHICGSTSRLLNGRPIKVDYTYVTATGSDSNSEMIETVLSYKGRNFPVSLLINNDLDAAFEGIEAEEGVTVDGILGTDFLRKYKCIIDFEELKCVL